MAVLFETHAMFVEDEDFVECITSMIEEESCNAEYAVDQAGIQFAAMFAAMEDAYMQARAADIKDVAKRIHSCLIPWEALDELSQRENAVTGGDVDYQDLDRQNVLALARLLKEDAAEPAEKGA